MDPDLETPTDEFQVSNLNIEDIALDSNHHHHHMPDDDDDDDDAATGRHYDEEEIPEALTASYSEISFHTNYGMHSYQGGSNGDHVDGIASSDVNFKDGALSRTGERYPQRPASLSCDKRKASSFLHTLEGTVSIDGNMTNFVAENLEYKIKLSSPVTKKDGGMSTSKTSTPSTSGLLPRQFMLSQQLPQIDSNVLNDVEIEAHYLAASVDNLTENLCNLLHSISSITADNVETYKNAVNKLTDCMDGNIKSMYTIMAKTEEISNAMKPTEHLSNRIRELKRLVDMLDGTV